MWHDELLRCRVGERERILGRRRGRDDVAAAIRVDLHRRDRRARLEVEPPARTPGDDRTSSRPEIAETVPSGSTPGLAVRNRIAIGLWVVAAPSLIAHRLPERLGERDVEQLDPGPKRTRSAI